MSTRNISGSEKWYERARARISGGVNSPSRSFDAVGGGAPPFIVKGAGPYLYDVDGNEYVDYLSAFGGLILGHAHPRVTAAIADAASSGTLFGTPTPSEVEFAERLGKAVPGLEQVRFTASGTEAVMSAIRLARAATGRSKILKFDGSYHGHYDPVLVAAGSGSSTLGISESAGIPDSVFAEVVSVPYNRPDAVAAAMDEHGADVAAVLVEPIVGNFGIVAPKDGFLASLREQADRHGALLIFDEVLTGFRYRFGSVQELLGVKPDIVTLGKIIGGGLAIGAYGGSAELMRWVSPAGPVYQDGTWAGNPMVMASGAACLTALEEDADVYARLDRYAAVLEAAILDAANRTGHPTVVNRYGGGLALYFTEEASIGDFEAVERIDDGKFGRFFRAIVAEGICLPPSKYEAWYVSAAHTEKEIDKTRIAIERAYASLH